MEVAFIPVAYTGALEFIGKAVVDRDRPVNAFNDLTECDFGRGAVEFIPAGHTLVRFGDAGLGELAQDLVRKAQGDTRSLGHILGTLFAARKRQAIGYTNCIIRFMGDSQSVPSFLSSEHHQYNLLPDECQ